MFGVLKRRSGANCFACRIIIAVGWMKPDAPKREDRKEIPLLTGGQGLAPERRFRLKNSSRLMVQIGVTRCHSNLWESSAVNRDAGSEVINVRAVSIARKTDTATVRQTK